MDPISIGASIAGLLTAIVQVSSLLKTLVSRTDDAPKTAQGVMAEVTDIGTCLDALQGYFLGTQVMDRSGRSLVMIEQVIVVLTDCVSIFSELEQTLESLKTTQPTLTLDKLRWAMKETVISKILQRLQASKMSLSLMLSTLTCTSVDEAHAAVRHLTALVDQVLKSNVDMSRRLSNLQRMHPALASHINPTRESIRLAFEADEMQTPSQSTAFGFTFDEDLWTSRVYKKATKNASRLSLVSAKGSGSLSCLSGLSLSDISNVSAICLPILPKEVWNYSRYSIQESNKITNVSASFEEWYSPSSKTTAFIRTAYHDGHYTNQYAQNRFTGHLVYRRFSIRGPYCAPAFIEGVMMIPKAQNLTRGQSWEDKIRSQGFRQRHADFLRFSLRSNVEDSTGWTQRVIKLLKDVPY